MNSMRPVIAITIGDPGGIGPEIVLKALDTLRIRTCYRPVVIGDTRILQYYIGKMHLQMELNEISHPEQARYHPQCVDVIAVNSAHPLVPHIGEDNALNGKAMIDYTDRALDLALHGEVDAVIAAPHTKKSVVMAGIPFDGYPSYVASRTATPLDDTFLMLVNDHFRIVNTTLHVSLRQASEMVHETLVYQAIQAAERILWALGIQQPRIAVAGLNPHAGESGMFGREEIEHIQPAIQRARDNNYDIHGPFPSDTLFRVDGPFDLYIAMYHDQAHIPIKLTGLHHASAFTIGTPIVFATVAHGSALDIAGKCVADPGSLMATVSRIATKGGAPIG